MKKNIAKRLKASLKKAGFKEKEFFAAYCDIEIYAIEESKELAFEIAKKRFEDENYDFPYAACKIRKTTTKLAMKFKELGGAVSFKELDNGLLGALNA